VESYVWWTSTCVGHQTHQVLHLTHINAYDTHVSYL